ncbi:hypothetical protein HHK36_010270 [Tetracentron sinense]|uniref:Nucleolar 27S pre-rRNA processing Urb2/Npa2 C-terminal domain-containing protein n=1 Tax=Tetracentron sinense TaxID=13715 RepID=A0A834ZKI6_TETSI|nr:hypothetical protein HHK36_010270 [Tetracentron sinense]
MADFEPKLQKKHSKKKRKLRDSEENERDSKTFRKVSLEREKIPKEVEEKEHRKINQQSGTWNNLNLILSIQNKELDLQRKIEIAFDFVKSRIDNKAAENQGFEIVLGVMEACLDFRCWEVFKFCMGESSNLHVPSSFSPQLLWAISCVVSDALSVMDGASLHGEETVFAGEGFELYNIIAHCVSLLFFSHGRLFNANLDLWVSTISAVIDLVHKTYTCNLASGNAGNTQTMVKDILLNGLFHPANVDGFLNFEPKLQEKRSKKKRKLRNSEENERDSKTFRKVSLEREKIPKEVEEEEHRKINQQSGPWNNLDLILSIQNKELDLQRKIEIAFDFVKSRIDNKAAENQGFEMVSISRLIAFLNDWIQSLLISSDKKIMVGGKKPRSGVMEACLDFRCWEVFKFCMEESSNLYVPSSFSPQLLRAISCVVRDALSVMDGASLHGEETVFAGEGFELYSIIPHCVSLLFFSHGWLFNANLDLWVSTISAVIDLVHKTYTCNFASGNAGSLLLRLSCLVMEPFASFLRVHPNPKNVFPIFVDRLLEPLLSLLVVLHLQTDECNAEWTGNTLKMVKDVLLNGLFHPAHVDGFLSRRSPKKYNESHERDVKDSKTIIKSYHRHFFQKLEKIVAEKMPSLDGIGELFRLFVVRVKKQKGASVLSEDTTVAGRKGLSGHLEDDNIASVPKVSAGNSSAISEKTYSSIRLDAETSRSLFNVFVQFMEPLLLNMKRYLQINLEVGPMLLDAHCILKSTNKILSSFMREKVYVRTEDTSERTCLNFLKEVYDTVLSFSAKINQLWLSGLDIDNERHMEILPLTAKELIAAVGSFLEIEYEVVGDDLVSLWLMMLSYSAFDRSPMDTPDRCLLTPQILKLGCQLVNVYSELRQVNHTIFALCKAVRFFAFHDIDGEMDYSRFVFCTPSLSPEAYVKSVAMLLCSQEFRLAIFNAIKSIPEGQASGSLHQLKMDISESLEWMKVSCSRVAGKESRKPNIGSCKKTDLNLQAELLGRGLSEVYTLILDSLTVTTGNSILVGNSLKDMMTAIRPSLSSLVAEQVDSVNEFLFSISGRRFSNHNTPECRKDFPTTGPGASWVFVFFFRLYISCRSLYRQSISFMPPDSSRKMSAAMGDLYTAYSGMDWMERTDWTDEGYFSWIIKPSASLPTIIQSVSDICLQHSIAECASVIYVLHVMALQRLVDLNRQIKAFEFLQERVVQLVQMKLTDDAGLPLSRKESRKRRRHISILRQEAAVLTSYILGYLSLMAKKVQFISTNGEDMEAWAPHGNDAWDMVVCSLNEKSLPAAIWWIVCQNTDIWCSHATKKKLKKFLSLLICNSLSHIRSSFGDAGKHNMFEPGYLRKVNVHQISLELLGDTALYEQTFLRRHLRSRFCHVLEKLILPPLSNPSNMNVGLNSLPDWAEVISTLENMSVAVSNRKHVVYDGSSVAEPNFLPSNMLPTEGQKGQKDFPLISTELVACQSLLNLLCWMPKSYVNSRSFTVYAIYILNLERVPLDIAVVYFILGCVGGIVLGKEENICRFENGQFMSRVVGLRDAFSKECASQVEDMIFSLMDHTSYVFLILSKELFSLAVHSPIHVEKLPNDLPDPGLLLEHNNLVASDPDFDSSEHFDAWKYVVLMAETLKEQTKSLLDSLKSTLCNSQGGAGVNVVNMNKISSTMSCFQGFLWGLASVLNKGENGGTVNTKTLRWKLGPLSELNLCINVFEDFIKFFLQLLFVEDSPQPENLCDAQSLPKLHCVKGSMSLAESAKHQENLEGGRDCLTSVADDDPENTMGSGMNCIKNSSVRRKSLHSDHVGFAVDILTEVDSFEHRLKEPLLRSLLKGENPEVAFLLRQLFIASSAILRLQMNCTPSTSSLIPVFIAISQFLLLEFADMVKEPHSFSFVWLDGVLKYLEVLGSHISLNNPTSSRNMYAKLIDVHLRAIGKCISLQGKRATLASHERESNTKALQGQRGLSDSSLDHVPYSLDEFKARLRMSFKVFIRKPLELHLLSAIQALEKALVGVQVGCTMIYEINTGSPDGGKVSSIVAAGIDCLDLVLESVSGRKRLSVVKRHIQSLISGLFNIVLHLQGPLIFYGKLTCNRVDNDPDPGSVILMCVEVLTRIAGKHALSQMGSCHVGQSLHIPTALFQEFRQLRASEAPPNSVMFSYNQESRPVAGMNPIAVDQQFSVDLFAACCRLLCTILRHHKSESERCVALLEDSVCVLLHCLETVGTDVVVRKGCFAWQVQEGVKCASFLRRIYEEEPGFLFRSNMLLFLLGQVSDTWEIDEALRPGVYALIDACSPDDLQLLHTVLGEGPCRSTLATLQHDYKLNFQYEGKVNLLSTNPYGFGLLKRNTFLDQIYEIFRSNHQILGVELLDHQKQVPVQPQSHVPPVSVEEQAIPSVAKVLAVRLGIVMAFRWRLASVTIITDAKLVVEAIYNPDLCLPVIRIQILDVKLLLSSFLLQGPFLV